MQSSEEIKLIIRAQAGIRAAQEELFTLYQEDIRKGYEFGPDGIRPRNLGYAYNCKGSTLKSNSGLVFEWFKNAVVKYDFRMGMSFKSYILQEVNFRSKDTVRARLTIEKYELPESSSSLAGIDREETGNVFDNLQKDAANEAYLDNEHQKECESACDAIEALFTAGSNERRYIELYRELGQIYNNPNTAIAEAMGVSRQAVDQYKHNIRRYLAKYMEEHGDQFLLAA